MYDNTSPDFSHFPVLLPLWTRAPAPRSALAPTALHSLVLLSKVLETVGRAAWMKKRLRPSKPPSARLRSLAKQRLPRLWQRPRPLLLKLKLMSLRWSPLPRLWKLRVRRLQNKRQDSNGRQARQFAVPLRPSLPPPMVDSHLRNSEHLRQPPLCQVLGWCRTVLLTRIGRPALSLAFSGFRRHFPSYSVFFV